MPGPVADPLSAAVEDSRLLYAVLTLMSLFTNRKSSTSSTIQQPIKSAGEDDICPLPHPQLRTAFGSKSTGVRAWPSQGGFYSIYPAGIVELDFLDLDRFSEAPRSEDPTKEDALCQRMRAMGAEWFRHEE